MGRQGRAGIGIGKGTKCEMGLHFLPPPVTRVAVVFNYVFPPPLFPVIPDLERFWSSWPPTATPPHSVSLPDATSASSSPGCVTVPSLLRPRAYLAAAPPGVRYLLLRRGSAATDPFVAVPLPCGPPVLPPEGATSAGTTAVSCAVGGCVVDPRERMNAAVVSLKQYSKSGMSAPLVLVTRQESDASTACFVCMQVGWLSRLRTFFEQVCPLLCVYYFWLHVHSPTKPLPDYHLPGRSRRFLSVQSP